MSPQTEEYQRLIIAVYNWLRHKAGICCHNHSIEYRGKGWVTIDGARQRVSKEVKEIATDLQEDGVLAVPCRNTWVIPS